MNPSVWARPLRARAVVVFGWLLAAILGACSRESYEHYRTRGTISVVEGHGAERSVIIHHERISSFQDREGKRAPMDSMKMMFGLHEQLAERPLAPGDKLSFEFDVRWELRPTLLITQFERLPPDTALDLRSDSHLGH